MSVGSTARPLLDLPALEGGRFPPAPFRARNALATHPLFEPDRIRRLLRALPKDAVEIRAVETSVGAAQGYRRGRRLADVDPVEAFDALERTPTWMLLHRTWQHDADYGDLLKAYLAGLRDAGGELAGGLCNVGCWMFLSSGGSVVHFHADDDQSFLNQIRGTKTVYVYPARVLPEETVERMVFFEDQGEVTYDARYEAEAYAGVPLRPGDSVFLPLFAPHRVVNDASPCVSWNVGFHTRRSLRRRTTHVVNLELRRLGIAPRPVGGRPFVDGLKRALHLPLRVKNRVFPGLRPARDRAKQ